MPYYEKYPKGMRIVRKAIIGRSFGKKKQPKVKIEKPEEQPKPKKIGFC